MGWHHTGRKDHNQMREQIRSLFVGGEFRKGTLAFEDLGP
jgi:hypothetical protein